MRWDGEGRIGEPRVRALCIVVADRQPLVAAALAAWLTAEGHDVVGQATDGAGLLALCDGALIDAAIVDIEITDPDALAVLTALRVHGEGVPVVALAASAHHPGLSAIIDSGLAGLVLKCERADVLRRCLDTVTSGGRWIDAGAAADATERAQAQRDAMLLTRRERDVARLVATGQRNRAIAGSLGITEGTVKMHLHNVFAKLGLESRTQLAMDERLRMAG